MMSSDSQALRGLLFSIFDRQATCVAEADTIKTITADILAQATAIVADIRFQWNASNPILIFPPEVLAMCFSFLPFESRVTASHVSRAWRTAALESPALWADISHWDGSEPPSSTLIKMAVSRAGTVPVRLRYAGVPARADEQILRSLIHRIGSLTIQLSVDSDLLHNPAPLLEYLVYLTHVAHIHEDFLGGQIGKLKSFHAHYLVLPSTCLALSTVTELRGSFVIQGPEGNLFSLCPRLQSLSLLNLISDIARPQFFERAPSSLTRLELETFSPRCDLLPVYRACNVDSLRDVVLRFPVKGTDRDLGPLLDGVLDLRVEATFSPDLIVLTAILAGGRRHTISIDRLIEHHYRHRNARRAFPPIFAQSAACLAQLQILSIPITVLATFVADAPPLPALTELRLHIASGMRLEFGGWPTDSFPWGLLHALSDVRVQHVVLDVVRAGDRVEDDVFGEVRAPQGVEQLNAGPTEKDARDMLAALASSSIGDPGRSTVSVRGFAGAVVAKVDVPARLKDSLSFDEV